MSENENVQLKPAEENPWYVLATICDIWNKGDERFFFNGRRLSNHHVWNSWIISRLDSEQKKLIDKDPLPKAYLKNTPDWADISKWVKKRFEERMHRKLNEFERQIRESWWDNYGGKSTNFNIDFRKTVFKKRLILNFFIIPPCVEILFIGSKFTQGADFMCVKSYSFMVFHSAHFCKKAKFDSGFFNDMNFVSVIFDALVNLSHAVFEGKVNFNNCEFRMPADFSDVQFREEYPKLINTIFREKITLSAKQNTKEITYWPDPENCKQNPKEAKYSCEVLREQMETQGLHEQAHFFFRREMHFARKTGSFWQAIPNWFFYFLSDYGYSILRPVIGLLSCWITGALIYFDTTKLTFGGAMGLSISNLLQITGLQRVYWSDFIQCLPWGLKFLGGLQTLLAIPLLFLLLLGLRNRFRLK